VLIGGLGLGCTAAAALGSKSVRHLEVVEFLEPVIDWHRRGLVPMADILLDDPRCELIQGDFFKYVADPAGKPDRRYDLILVDIDHSPESWLHATHEAFYSSQGLKRLAEHLNPGGVFGLWSADKPAREFIEQLGSQFTTVKQHTISYDHPMLHQVESDTIVIAQ
jgi:spermidine synthase